MQVRLSLSDILELLPGAESRGDWGGPVSGIASLAGAKPGDLSFLASARYARGVPDSAASLILLPRHYEGEPRADQRFLLVDNPSLALALVCEQVEAANRPLPVPGVHPSAVVSPDATVDPSASIGPLCYIGPGARVGAGALLVGHVHVGEGVTIGADSRLQPQVALYPGTEIGARVLLHAGVVVGADGFGYESGREGHRKVPQLGRVVIEDDVEIGANSTVDRARLEETRIGRGTKIDNLVQIGHNVRIGRHCLLCAFAGISGSTELGDFVVMAGQSATSGHIRIGDHSQVGGQSGVAKNLPAGSVVTGTPATDYQRQRRVEALSRRLPELFERVTELESLLREGGHVGGLANPK